MFLSHQCYVGCSHTSLAIGIYSQKPVHAAQKEQSKGRVANSAFFRCVTVIRFWRNTEWLPKQRDDNNTRDCIKQLRLSRACFQNAIIVLSWSRFCMCLANSTHNRDILDSLSTKRNVRLKRWSPVNSPYLRLIQTWKIGRLALQRNVGTEVEKLCLELRFMLKPSVTNTHTCSSEEPLENWKVTSQKSWWSSRYLLLSRTDLFSCQSSVAILLNESINSDI